MLRFRTAVLLALIPLSACGGDAPPKAPSAVQAATIAAPSDALTPADNNPLGPGEARLAVDGGRIWYKQGGGGSATPVILLHGGPGFPSYYLTALEALGDERLVVRYDQLGAGRSDRLTDTTKMTIEHFVRELESLRAHLGYETVHLVGHSWGTILGFEYYRAHPEHVASLTLAGACLDLPAYERHAKELVGTLSEAAQRAIRAGEAAGKYDAPEYQAAMQEFYGKYVWRTPKAAELDMTMKTLNDRIYGYMQGPSEFTIVGTLKSYDSTPFLKDVKVPTLYTVGEFDEVGPELVRGFAIRPPGAQFFIVPRSAHVFTWDNPEAGIHRIREFLRGVDAKKGTASR